MKLRIFICLAIIAGLIIPVLPVAADEANPMEGAKWRIYPDARLSRVTGPVYIQQLTETEWHEAGNNFPVQEGDRITTGTGGRGVVEFTDSNILRFWENTKFDVNEITKEEGQARWRTFNMLGSTYTAILDEGSSVYVEQATPATMVRATKRCRFRTDILESGETAVKVYEGTVEVLGKNESIYVSDGRQTSVKVGGDPAEPEEIDRRDTDEFDEWNNELNDKMASGESEKYLGENADIGAEELDEYGDWVEVQEYGYAWRPYVSVGWSPYYCGGWYYYGPYGWVWIGCEPWGWIPYHYGSWTWTYEYGWVWIPGGWYWRPACVWWYYDNYDRIGWVAHHPKDNYRNIVYAGQKPQNALLENAKGFTRTKTDYFLHRSSDFYEQTTLIDKDPKKFEFFAKPQKIPPISRLEESQKYRYKKKRLISPFTGSEYQQRKYRYQEDIISPDQRYQERESKPPLQRREAPQRNIRGREPEAPSVPPAPPKPPERSNIRDTGNQRRDQSQRPSINSRQPPERQSSRRTNPIQQNDDNDKEQRNLLQ